MFYNAISEFARTLPSYVSSGHNFDGKLERAEFRLERDAHEFAECVNAPSEFISYDEQSSRYVVDVLASEQAHNEEEAEHEWNALRGA